MTHQQVDDISWKTEWDDNNINGWLHYIQTIMYNLIKPKGGFMKFFQSGIPEAILIV